MMQVPVPQQRGSSMVFVSQVFGSKNASHEVKHTQVALTMMRLCAERAQAITRPVFNPADSKAMDTPDASPERTLWSAHSTTAPTAWTELHDRVMGGRSTGHAQPHLGQGSEPDHVRFAGHISRDNGGGFASFRLRLADPARLGEARAIALTARGDGGPFKLCLHRQDDWDGVQWQADLSSSNEWTHTSLPLSAFVARRRGRELRERPLAAGDTLYQLGLMSSRTEAGPFWLALARIALR
jgi:hypothetical protein